MKTEYVGRIQKNVLDLLIEHSDLAYNAHEMALEVATEEERRWESWQASYTKRVNGQMNNLRERGHVNMSILNDGGEVAYYRVTKETREMVKKGELKFVVTKMSDNESVWSMVNAYTSRPGPNTSSSELLKKAKEEGRWIPGPVLCPSGRESNSVIAKMVASGYLDMRDNEELQVKEFKITDFGKAMVKKLVGAEDNIDYVERFVSYVQKFEEYISHEIVPMGDEVEVLRVRYTRGVGTRQMDIKVDELNSQSRLQSYKRKFVQETGNRFAAERRTENVSEEYKKAAMMAESYLDNPNYVNSMKTVFGVLELKGGVDNAWFELNGRRICIVPAQRVSRYDNWLSKLMWLNREGDHVERLLSRAQLRECMSCKTNFGGLLYDNVKWKYCPVCGANIKEMEDKVLEKARIIKGGSSDAGNGVA